MNKTSLLLSLSCVACGGMVETEMPPADGAPRQEPSDTVRGRDGDPRVHLGGPGTGRPMRPRRPAHNPTVGNTQGNTPLQQALLDAAAQVVGVDDLGGPAFQLVNLARPAPQDALADLNLPQGMVMGLSAYDPGSQRYFSQSGQELQVTHLPTAVTTPLATEPLLNMEYDPVDNAIYGLASVGSLRLVRVDLVSGASTVVADLGALSGVAQASSALDLDGREYFFARGGAVWAVDMEGGTLRQVANVDLRNFQFCAATGELVGTLDQAGAPFARVHTQTAALVTGVDLPGTYQGASTLSPDGAWYFTARPLSEEGVSQGELTVVDVATGQVLGTVLTRAVTTLEHLGTSNPL